MRIAHVSLPFGCTQESHSQPSSPPPSFGISRIDSSIAPSPTITQRENECLEKKHDRHQLKPAAMDVALGRWTIARSSPDADGRALELTSASYSSPRSVASARSIGNGNLAAGCAAHELFDQHSDYHPERDAYQVLPLALRTGRH
eukprot:SAG11_NODE_1910_length_4079_cov_3.969095_5_plen_145_part_00